MVVSKPESGDTLKVVTSNLIWFHRYNKPNQSDICFRLPSFQRQSITLFGVTNISFQKDLSLFSLCILSTCFTPTVNVTCIGDIFWHAIFHKIVDGNLKIMIDQPTCTTCFRAAIPWKLQPPKVEIGRVWKYWGLFILTRTLINDPVSKAHLFAALFTHWLILSALIATCWGLKSYCKLWGDSSKLPSDSYVTSPRHEWLMLV